MTVTIDVVPAGTGEITVDGFAPDSYPSPQAVIRGNDVTLEAIPIRGYSFVKWSGELLDNENDELLELNKVIRNMSITAHFAPDAMQFTSEDELLRVTIPPDTTALAENGEPLTLVQINVADIPTSEQTGVIGLPYELAPSGATFDPPITITWRYNPAELPTGIAEEELVINYLNDGGEWIEVPSDVDYEKDMITAEIDHFTVFALRDPTLLSQFGDTMFTASSLDVSPSEVSAGEPVAISVLLTNTGADEGNYSLTLLIDGAVAETKATTVAGNASETVTFTVTTGEVGVHSVDLNGLFGSFTVKESTSPPAPPPPLAESPPTSPGTPTPPADTGLNWAVLAPIIVGVFLAIFIPLRLRRRASYDW